MTDVDLPTDIDLPSPVEDEDLGYGSVWHRFLSAIDSESKRTCTPASEVGAAHDIMTLL